jgi:hypothetical protein
MRFVDELFTIDVPQLRKGGRLQSIVAVAAACLIGNYIKLVSDVGTDNPIVTQIQSAAQSAKIDDINVPPHAEPRRWNVVLRSWSKTILDNFHDNNPIRASTHAALSDQGAVVTNVQALSRRVESLEATIVDIHDHTAAVDMARDSSAISTQDAHQLEIKNRSLQAELRKVKGALATMMKESPPRSGSSPRSPPQNP